MIHPSFSGLEQGIFHGMPFDAYKEIEAANASSLKHILRSPAHYFWNRNNQQKDTAALQLGRIVHLAFLEPKEFLDRYRIYPDFGKGTGSRTKMWDWEKEQLAERMDAVLIKQDTAEQIVAMVSSINAHPKAAALMREGASEVVLTWRDSVFELDCKVRFDFLVPKESRPIIVDLKITRNADYDAFSKDASSRHYDLAAAQYVAAGKAHYGEEPPFVYIAVEHEPPYAVQVFAANEAWMDLGMRKRNRAMGRLKTCIQNQEFPAYSKEIVNLGPPHWAFYEYEEEEDLP